MFYPNIPELVSLLYIGSEFPYFLNLSILPVSPVFKPVVGKLAKFSFFAKLHHVVKFCEFSENVFLIISAKCKSTNWSKSRFFVIAGMII